MELTKLLQYQKIDMGVYKQEKEFTNSKERELLVHCKKTFDEKKNALVNLAKELENTLSLIGKLSEKLSELLSVSDWENFDINSIGDEEKLLAAETKFAEYEGKIAEIKDELEKAMKKQEDIDYENKRLNEAMEELNSQYKRINTALEKKRNAMLELIKPALVQLKTLIPDIDKGLFEKYVELRKSKKMPALVVYNEGCCGACGMNIDIEVGKKLINSGDVSECPHCGRMVYKA